MNRPITVARKDYADAVIKLTNESGLPFFAVVDVLKEVLMECQELSKKELERDLERYAIALRKQESIESDPQESD